MKKPRKERVSQSRFPRKMKKRYKSYDDYFTNMAKMLFEDREQYSMSSYMNL